MTAAATNTSSYQPYNPSDNPKPEGQPYLVERFFHLWTEWYQTPDQSKGRETGEKLQSFLAEDATFNRFTVLASHNQPPYPGAVFKADYCGAQGYMKVWLEEGANPETKVGPSEMLHNVYLWVYQQPAV